MKENKYDFRARMSGHFLRFLKDPDAVKSAGETEISSQWSIVKEGPEHFLLDRAVFDLKRFMKSCMGIELKEGHGPREIVLCFQGPQEAKRSCEIEVCEEKIRLRGRGPKGILAGVLHLEKTMQLRQAPFLEKGSSTYEELVRMRSTHSGSALDDFPDWQLDAILHAGFTAIDLFVRGVDQTAKNKCDIAELIDRAEQYGLDVVLYSYMTCYVHPDDPKADEMFDDVYGKIFRAYPKAKAIHLVGESLEFPSKDAATVSVEEGMEGQDGIQPLKQMTGYYPSSDYPAYIGKVCKSVHEAAPEAEVIFNTYNWGWAPLDARKKFLQSFPEGVSLQVTYDIFKQEKRNSLACPVMDYSIYAEEPGFYFESEVKAAYEYGIRDIRVTSNLAGTTWDFGCVPYAPVPFRWIKRMEILREYTLNYSVNSFYDSHHYGWWPNVCNDLAHAYFSNQLPEDPVEILRKAAARDYGKKAADQVVEAWRIWSRAMDHYVASNEDQYGPWRVGPAYPFVFHPAITRTMDDKKVTFPFTENSYRCVNMVKPMYTPFENNAQSPGPLRCPVELQELDLLEKEWISGIEVLEKAFAEEDPQYRQEQERLLLLGRFIRNMIRTTKGIKKWRRENLRLQLAETRESMLFHLDELQKILEAERANVLETIPYAESDSRLGWEPRMDYVCDPAHLQWKLRQLENAEEEMQFYRDLINL